MRDRLYSLAINFPKTHEIWKTFTQVRNDCKKKLRTKMGLFFAEKTSKIFWKFYKKVFKTKNQMIDKSSQKFSILNQDLNYISQLKLQLP